MTRLPEAVVAALAPFIAEQDLRAMRILRGVPFRWLPRAMGMGAVTFDRWVIFRSDQYQPNTPWGLGLIAHEAFHITQRRRMGLGGFLLRYIGGQLTSGFRHDRHPLERPAIELQKQVVAALSVTRGKEAKDAVTPNS